MVLEFSTPLFLNSFSRIFMKEKNRNFSTQLAKISRALQFMIGSSSIINRKAKII